MARTGADKDGPTISFEAAVELTALENRLIRLQRKQSDAAPPLAARLLKMVSAAGGRTQEGARAKASPTSVPLSGSGGLRPGWGRCVCGRRLIVTHGGMRAGK